MEGGLEQEHKLELEHKELNSLITIINKELELLTWFQSNRFECHLKFLKTNFVIFRNSRKLLPNDDSIDI